MCPRTGHTEQQCAVCKTVLSIGDEPHAEIAHDGPLPEGRGLTVANEDYWFEPLCSPECVSAHQNGHGSAPVVLR